MSYKVLENLIKYYFYTLSRTGLIIVGQFFNSDDFLICHIEFLLVQIGNNQHENLGDLYILYFRCLKKHCDQPLLLTIHSVMKSGLYFRVYFGQEKI